MKHHRSLSMLATLGLLALPAAAQDIRAIKIEQDVLELQNQVRVLQRRLESLESQQGVRAPVGTPPGSTAAAADTNARWLNHANWERIKPGQSELEVIGILGVPNAVRRAADNSSQTLLYALEISSGGFLTGSVTISGQKVVEIQKPTLK